MSRYALDGKDERGRYVIESLADEKGCRYLINEVCCNGDNRDMVGDFPMEGDCEECPHFVPEPPEEIPQLSVGRATYADDVLTAAGTGGRK